MERVKNIAEKLARYGCYSVASVYIMVGLMALLSFMGVAEDAADEERMIDVVMEIPFGEVLISIMILGLLGYVTWRVYEAFADPYNFGSSLKGKAQRVGIGLSAIGYVLIAIGATQILFGGGGDSESEQKLFISQVLGWPGGQILVGIAGLILGFTALVQIKYIYGGDYHKRMEYEKMPSWIEKATHITAWAGYIARSIILGVLGYFLIKAAIYSDSDEAGDTDSAFDFLGDFGTIGHIIFIAVALGTICYGIFMIISGYYYSFEEEGDGEDE
jgi:hypothetical protein